MSSTCSDILTSHYVLFSCEGTAEGVIIEKLLLGGKLLVPVENVVKDPLTYKHHTRLRKGCDIAKRFLGADYTIGDSSELVIARITDVNPGPLKLTALQKRQVIVLDFVTKREIEMLSIVKENAYDAWLAAYRKNRQIKPSDYCINQLGLVDIKSASFLESYWEDPECLANCIRVYSSKLGKRKHDELGLVDLLGE